MSQMRNDRTPIRDTVAGAVLPDSWDPEFHVTGVIIACERERELVVENLGQHRELLDLFRRKVSVTGMVHFDGRRERIHVERVNVLDSDGDGAR